MDYLTDLVSWWIDNGGDFITTMLESFFRGGDIVFGLGIYILQQSLNKAVELLTTSPYDASYTTMYNGMINSFGVAVSATATVLLTLIWVVGFMKASADYEKTSGISTIFFQLARFFVPIALINGYAYVISIIVALFNNVIAALPDTVTNINISLGFTTIDLSSWEAASNTFATLGLSTVEFFNPLMRIIDGVFTLIIFGYAVTTSIKVILAALLRTFKLYIAIIMAPIAFAMYGARETDQMGTRYLTFVGKFMLEAIFLIASIYLFTLYRTALGSTIESIIPTIEFAPNLNLYIKTIIDISVLSAMISGAEHFSDRLL